MGLCIDFRKVNSVTVPDPYDMPLIEDLLDQVGEAVYVPQLDLTKGFYQILLEAHDRDKLRFVNRGENLDLQGCHSDFEMHLLHFSE